MATQNLRIDNGLSVGEIVIDATNNTITGLTTSAPSADGDVANKKYVDDSVSGLSATTIQQGDTSVVVADSGTGTITVTADGGSVASFAAANTTITASNNINLTATGDVVIPANVGITFGTGEKIEGNDTDLTITSGAKINLSATSDVQIPNDVGLLFGTGGEKIESNGTDLTVTSTGALNLTVTGTTTVSGALTVTGNLTVNGTTVTNNADNLLVDDPLIELNHGLTGANASDLGIIMERGSTGDNAFMGWDESTDKFIVGTTTATGASTGDLTITTGTLVAATFEGNLTGTATAAQYSDVAERFASDRAYDPGTVVALGGTAEITAVAEEASNQVFGVVSGTHQAAFKMNGAAGTDETHPYVAMTGRVNVKVIGTVNKGDRLISSSIPGVARAAVMTECTAFNVIGRALESKHTQEAGVVLAAVRVSH